MTEEKNVVPKALFLHLGTRLYALKRVKRVYGHLATRKTRHQ